MAEDKKRGIWYYLAKAWKNRDTAFEEVLGDGSMIGMTPEAQFGLIAGENLVTFVNWIINNFNIEELEEALGPIAPTIGMSPESRVGVELGKSLANSIENSREDWKDGLEDAEYENLTPDEIDAAREEKAQFTESQGYEPVPSVIEIQEELDAAEAADPEFQALIQDEPEDPASKFYTYDDFAKNTLNEDQWKVYVEAIKGSETSPGLTPAEAWGYATNSDPANFDYIYTWDGKKNKPAYILDEDYGPIPIPIAAQPTKKVLSKRFMSRLHNQFSPDQVEALKDVLIMSGVAEDGDFSGVGTIDRSLELIMENVLNMANTNYGHIAYKSDDYFKLVENASNLFGDNMPVGLSEQEKFEWGLVGVVLSQYGATQEKSAELAGIEAAKQEKLKNPLPSKETMANNIKGWIKEALYGTDATPEQIQEYTDYWISQETEWGKQIAYANKVAQVGMDIEHYHIKSGRTLSMEEVKAMEKEIGAGGDVLAGIVGTRDKIATVTDPATATFNKINTDLAGEKEIIEAGKKKRAKQSGILQAMAGKF